MQAATSLAPERAEPTVIRPPSRWVGFGLPELWRHRELLFFFAWRDLKVRYKQTFLGVTWAVLQPIMYMVVFSLFFGKIGKLYRPGIPYPLLTLSASVLWLFFANSVQLSANSLVGNASLITKVYFPRLLGAVAPVVAGLVDFVLSFGVLLVVMAAYGYYPGSRVWVALPALGLAAACAVGVGSWLAALNVKYRDVRYIVPFLLQLWLFASPVAYVSAGVLHGGWRTLYYLNPMAGAVDGFRWALLGGVPPGLGSVGLSTLVGALVLVAGVLYFRRKERQFADIV